jgi:aryl-alcohol dehydrogenase-like predicted oxidoreductase
MSDSSIRWNRRDLLASLAAAGAASVLPRWASALPRSPILTRAIPASGEALPVVGLGSWVTFNVGEDRRHWTVARFDLLQVHNVLNWEEHLPTLLAMKAAGRLRYVGITTSEGRRHAEIEKILRGQPIDFVQVTYNIVDREVEERILPLARERRVAVIINRPFQHGALIDRFGKAPLPPWASDIDCASWPQFLLKFIVSHPAVTCAIPATSRVDHVRENLGAAYGRLPDEATRRRMAAYVEKL